MALYTNKNSASTDNIRVEMPDFKKIQKMFKSLAEDELQEYKIWKKFWRKNTKPMAEMASQLAPVAKKRIPYPPAYGKLTRKEKKNFTGPYIEPFTLANSIGFFTTKTSKFWLGGYVGPKVKGRFRKEKGGYFGPWVEYGSEVKYFGEHMGKSQKFMEPAFIATKDIVLANGMRDAELIFKRETKRILKKNGF